MDKDEKYMRVALGLARKGRGKTSPNPMVGAVVVRGKAVVGKGYHHRAGEPHAEVLALRQAGEKARGATLYLNLEPCDHFGKTPPCTQTTSARSSSTGCRTWISSWAPTPTGACPSSSRRRRFARRWTSAWTVTRTTAASSRSRWRAPTTAAWVVNHLSDDVSVVNLNTLHVRATLRVGDEPGDVVFANGKASVSVMQEDVVKVYDPGTLALLATVPVNGRMPRALAKMADGSRVYVASFLGGNKTSVLSPAEVPPDSMPFR